jgi:hypothetical protein
MTTATCKPERTLRLVQPFNAAGVGVLRICSPVGKSKFEVKTYTISLFRSDWGEVGMEWKNQATNEKYEVNVNGSHSSSCSCPWQTYTDGQKKNCRHIAAALLLKARGQLVLPAPLSEEPIVNTAGYRVCCGA